MVGCWMAFLGPYLEAAALDELLTEIKQSYDTVLSLLVPDDLLVDRMLRAEDVKMTLKPLFGGGYRSIRSKQLRW